MKRFLASLLLACSSVLLPVQPSAAADFPTRSIRFVVPFTPGTGMDRIARLVGEDLKGQWGQAVVVENRTGAAGHIGAQFVANSPNDGYTVLVTASNLSITATLLKSATFDATKDLKPLLVAAYGDSALVVPAKSPFTSLQDVVKGARSRPNSLTFATPGVGSPMHIGMAELEDAAGIKFNHIPYNGTGPAVTDLIAGQIDMMFVATHTVMPYVNAGQLRVLAVAAPRRNPLFPSIPSFPEEGVKDVSTLAWYGFMLPKGVPPDVAQKLYNGIFAALNKPAIKDDLQKFGLQVRPSTMAEMDELFRTESQRYADIIKRHNIKSE